MGMVQTDPTPRDTPDAMPSVRPMPGSETPHTGRRSHDDDAHAKRRFVRSLGITAMLVAFVMLASYIRPSDSRALPELSRPNPTPYVAPGDDITTPLGSLEGREYVLEIVSTAEGVRYDVYDLDGTLLLERATPEQLEQVDPALAPSTMQATPMGLVTDDFDY